LGTICLSCTEADSPVPELFDLLLGFVRVIPTHPSPLPVLAFEVKLLRLLGMAPDQKWTSLTAGSRRLLGHLDEMDWPELTRLKPSDAQFRELSQFLHEFLTYHLGRVPRGRANALL
jgi:hypothetical protein